MLVNGPVVLVVDKDEDVSRAQCQVTDELIHSK